MASIIKNQILKHLSKFTKNLSPDKINLSTLKGEGELSNLELDEVILMELLDLPTWMKLSKAVCNRLSIKVQWTKLKSQPLCLFLDEVELEIETCENPRPPNSPAHVASYRSGGKYGFVDRVIDGIYVHINSVSVKFISKKFHASLQLSRVKVHSVTPAWKESSDLGPTKIRDSERGEILLFKEIDWQTTRIEATAVEGESSQEFVSTPLRFIANQSKIRITIKKRLSDCGIIATRVMLLLDDLLWVLTDTQLKAAILYISSLKDLMEKSRQQSKNLAAEKLQLQRQSTSYDDYSQQTTQRPRSQSNTSVSRIFTRFDVQTTSYHVISSRIDLHLCDDNMAGEIHGHNKQIEGGAMQVTIYKLSVDIYPFNPAGGERKGWFRYTDNQGSRNHWVQQLFKSFKADVSKARETMNIASPSQSPAHTTANQKSDSSSNQISSNKIPPARPPPPNASQTKIQGSPPPKRSRSTKLLESCFVLKIEEFTIYQVSTADNKRNTPQKFLSSDKKQLHLPADMSVIHAEYTDYFFPEGIDFPVPHANVYILINPIRLNVDWLTVLWTNYFMLNLSQSIGNISLDDTPIEHVDMKLEAIMPRVVIHVEEDTSSFPDFPGSIQLQISKLCATNTRVEQQSSRVSLSSIIDNYNKSPLFHSHHFPNDNNLLSSIPDNFKIHAQDLDNSFIEKNAKDLIHGNTLPQIPNEEVKAMWKTNTLKQDASFDIWCFNIEQVWLEFLAPSNVKSRPVPFVDSLPVTIWVCKPKPTTSTDCDKNGTKSNSSHSSAEDLHAKEKLNSTVNKTLQIGEKSSGDSTCERESRKARKLLKDFYSDESDSSKEEKNDYIFHRSQTSICDTQKSANSDVQYSSMIVADFNLLAQIGPGCLKAQMTHAQYLFLMRLLDAFTIFQMQMNADVEYFLNTTSPSLKFSVPLIVTELEFAMICPYVAENTCELYVSPPGSTSGQEEDIVDEEAGEQEQTTQPSNETISEKDVPEVQIQEDLQEEKHRSLSVLDAASHLVNSQISKSLSDSNVQNLTPTPEAGQPVDLIVNGLPTRNSHSSQALSSMSSVGRESGYSSDAQLRSQSNKKSSSKASDQMKKFTSKVSGFADKIKAKMDMGEDSSSISDDLDNLSIRTDNSDDELDFEELSLDDLDMPAFQKIHSETASISTDTDAMDDLSSFCAEQNAAEARGRELISVVLFKLHGVEVLLQGDGTDVMARIQSQHLHTIQPGNMIHDEFQQKFLSQSGFFSAMEQEHTGETRSVMLKFTAPNEATPGSDKGFLRVKAQEFGLHFTMSSLTSLTAFIEDDKATESVPMHVDLCNFMLTLQEDKPQPGAPSKLPEPVKLNMHELTITRGSDGILHLAGNPDLSTKILHATPPNSPQMPSKTSGNEQNEMQTVRQLKYEMKKKESEISEKDIKLKNQLSHIQDLESENRSLHEQMKKFAFSSSSELEATKDLRAMNEAYVTENLRLIEKVGHLEDELNSMSQEKDSLITTLKFLQDELNVSERKRHHSHSEK